MKRKKILSKESEALFTRMFIGWGFIALVLALTADAMRWDIAECSTCERVYSYFQFIVVSTRFTSSPEALEIQWMFLLITAPLMVLLLLFCIRDLRRGDMRPLAFWFMIGVFIFGLHTVNGGLAIMENATNSYARFYRETILGGAIYSIMLWVLVASSAYFIAAYIIALITTKRDRNEFV